jgi:GNAT superfamily N-acetyltransferase
MGERLTLVADARVVASREVALPDGLTMRAVTDADAEALAQLYLSAYHPSPGAMSLIETREEMRANFAGESGELWREASPVVVDADGTVLACVMTVTAAPLDWGRPPGPYVIEVLTSFLWRGRGLASALLAEAARTVVAAGRETMTLRVDVASIGATRLYAAAGFVGLTEADADALARARAADVGDWRSRLRRVEPKPRRHGILGSADATSGALSVFAMAVVFGSVVVPVGLVLLAAALFFSVFADSSAPVSPSPSVSVSAAP